MPLKEPTSLEECIYFTQRVIDKGKVKAWVFKGNCPKCNEGLMGKPRDPKTGKVRIRAKEYTCPKCNYTVEKNEHESTLTANIQYTCPYCQFQGGIQVPFKRKKVQRFNEKKQKKETVEALRFQCDKCGKNIDITKKMK